MRRFESSWMLVVFALLAGGPALAAPEVDESRGFWVDRFVDLAGLNEGASINVAHDAAARILYPADESNPGVAVTMTVRPVSFSSWQKVYVGFTASNLGDVTAVWVPEGGTALPLTLMTSDDPAFAAMADITNMPLSGGAVQVTLANRDVDPTLQAVKITWSPMSIVRVGLAASSPTTCSGAELEFRVRTSVSFVTARKLVAWAPLPQGELPQNARNAGLQQVNAVSFVRANFGGLYTASNLDVDGVLVPADSVYWRLGDRLAGDTFQLSFVVRPPNGTLAGTVYYTEARASATNAPPAHSPKASASVTSAPVPKAYKSVSGAYRIDTEWRSYNDETLTFNLVVANETQSTCGETYFLPVVWDSIWDLANTEDFDPSRLEIAGGGFYTEEGFTTSSGVWVPPQSVYWDNVAPLTPGAARVYSYSVTLWGEHGNDADPNFPLGRVLWDTVTLASGFRAPTDHASLYVRIGIPNDPRGMFALGDRIRGVSEIRAWNPDNRHLTLTYGETYTQLLHARNTGASALANVVMIEKVPALTQLQATYLPAGDPSLPERTTRYFYDEESEDPFGELFPSNAPPAFYEAGSSAKWLTVLPSGVSLTDVRWVAFEVPRLASQYFGTPDGGIAGASSVTAEMILRVLPPDNVEECPEYKVSGEAWFSINGFIPLGEGTVEPIVGAEWTQDVEEAEVIGVKPNLSNLSLGCSPSIREGAGEIACTAVITNRQPGGAQTDTAHDVALTMSIPEVSVNGVPTRLPFLGLQGDGGTVALEPVGDFPGLPSHVRVSWEAMAPEASRVVTLRLRVPAGLVDGTVFGVGASVVGHDDYCGTTNASKLTNVTVRVSPYLQVSKSVAVTVAGTDTLLDYGLTVRNTGDGVSTKTWVVDRVPVGTRFVRAADFGGEVWVSDAEEPDLPTRLTQDFQFDDAVIRALFVPAQLEDGAFRAPGVMQPTYVAFLVDRADLNPPQFGSGAVQELSFMARIDPATPAGTLLTNEGLVTCEELIQSIGNRVQTIVAERPSIVIAHECPGVVTSGEEFDYVLSYRNDSTNTDVSATVTLRLPDEVECVSVSHAFIPAQGYDIWPSCADVVDHLLTVNVTTGGPLESLEGGELRVRVRGLGQAATGTLLTSTSTGRAEGEAGSVFNVAGQCIVGIENADLTIVKAVDVLDPVSGSDLTYTLLVSNRGRHAAEEVAIQDYLPEGLTYVAGSTLVTTPGWSLTPSNPTVEPGWFDGRTVTVLRWKGLAGPAGVGVMPGLSADVMISFRARLDAGLAAGTMVKNCAEVATSTTEDAVLPNTACASSQVPLPDVWSRKTAQAVALPGMVVNYVVTFGNDSKQPAQDVVLVDRLPRDDDGAVAVRLLGVRLPAGMTAWYFDAGLGDAPAMNPEDPAASGWAASPAGMVPTHVAWVAGDLGPWAGPLHAELDVELKDPRTGIDLIPGVELFNCVAAVGADGADARPDNDMACVKTITPAVDLALTLLCDPDGGYPGTLPGREVAYTLTVRNSGTVPAHGIFVDVPLDASLEYVSDDGAVVSVQDGNGEVAAPVDLMNAPIPTGVVWEREGSRYFLGLKDEAAALWFRNVGLLPGHVVTLTVRARVLDTVTNNTTVANQSTVGTEYRSDWQDGDPEETESSNNMAACATVAYRSDVMIDKAVVNATTGSATVADGGDVLTYTVSYNNIGGAEAENVMIEDTLPEGLSFLTGSFSGLPDDVTVRYDDGTGEFRYMPIAGAADPAVRAFRVVFDDVMTAPVGGVFGIRTQPDFEAGQFAGTVYKADETSVKKLELREIPGPLAVKMADVTVDGWNDVVVATMSNGVQLYANDHAGNFARIDAPEMQKECSQPIALEAADLVKQDGFVDLAVLCADRSAVMVFSNDGKGGFSKVATLPIDAKAYDDVAIGDINKDGFLDLAASAIDPYRLWVWLSKRGEGFETLKVFDESGPVTQVEIADVDGDGDGDLIYVLESTKDGGGALMVRRANEKGELGEATLYATGGTKAHGLATGDFDGDGDPDIAVGNLDQGTVNVLDNQGDGTFLAGQSHTFAGGLPRFLASGDVNRDGVPDMAVSLYGTAQVAFLVSDATGSLTLAGFLEADSEPGAVALGDLNRDNTDDVAVPLLKTSMVKIAMIVQPVGAVYPATNGATAYLSEVMPEGGCNVLEWGNVFVGGVFEAKDGHVTFTVMDADDNKDIEGYRNLLPDKAGRIDLSGLDGLAHPRIRIRADFVAQNLVGGTYCAGSGWKTDPKTPLISIPAKEGVWTDVGADYHKAALVRSDGTLWNLEPGSLDPSRLGEGTDWKLALGKLHQKRCAIRQDGTLWCSIGSYLEPQRMCGEPTDRWITVGATYDSLPYAIKTDGTMWQCNTSGTLTAIRPEERWMSVGGGYYHWCAVRTDGALFCFGSRKCAMGNGGIDGAQVGKAMDWVQVDGWRFSTCARKNDGTIWCWGDDNWAGLNGDGTMDNRCSPTAPVSLKGDPRVPITDFVDLDTSDLLAVGVTGSGEAWCWGRNQYGECGTGAAGTLIEPVKFGLGRYHWNKVSTGYRYTCAMEAGTATEASLPRVERIVATFKTDCAPTFTYQGLVQNECMSSLRNQVQIQTSTPEVSADNDTAQVVTAVNRADVMVRVQADRSVFQEGDLVRYTVRWENRGPSTAHDVVVTFTPPEFTDGVVQVWLRGDLQAGEIDEIPVTVKVLTNEAGRHMVARAEIATSTIDCVPDNDQSSVTGLIGQMPNLWVTKTGPDAVRAGEPATFVIRYGNNGNAAMDGVVLTDLLPEGWTFLSAAPTPSVEDATGGIYQWDLGVLDRGAGGAVEVTLQAPGCDGAGVWQNNEAVIAGGVRVSEATVSDNAAIASVYVQAPLGELSLAAVPERSLVSVGEAVAYTVWFGNVGQTAVTDLVVTAVVPLGTSVVPGSISAGGFEDHGVVAWPVAALNPGQSGTVSFRVMTAQAGELTTETAVGCAGACPVMAQASATAVVEQTDDVVLAWKTASATTACPAMGDVIRWTVAVSNPGDVDLSNVTIVDVLDAAGTYVPNSIRGEGANDTGLPVLQWQIANLEAGAVRTVSFETVAIGDVGDLMTNAATVLLEGGTVLQTAEVLVRASCDGDLLLAKALPLDCQLTGDTVEVTLSLSNRLGRAATGIMVVDYLPAGTQFESSADGGVYDAVTGAIRFDATTTPALGDLADAAVATLRYVIRVPDVAGGFGLGGAWVSADGAAPQVSNEANLVVESCPDDGDSCTIEMCSAATGCYRDLEPDGTVCDADGNGCTEDDACLSGACEAGEFPCDDLDGCTVDSCASTGTNTHDCTNARVTCEDHIACTSNVCVPRGTNDWVCVNETIAGTCLILGYCYVDGQTDPFDPCLTCEDETPLVWTNVCGGTCGNGVVDAGEACDDGNVIPGDGCDTNCTTDSCVDELWMADGFNVFVFDSYMGFHDVLGRIAAGGDVGATSFSVARLDPGRAAIVSGGEVFLSNGTVYGDLFAAGDAELSSVDLRGTSHENTPVDFGVVETVLKSLSLRLAGLVPNGTVTALGTEWDPQWVLAGNDPVINVFETTAAVWDKASSVTVSVPAGATALINISGASVSMSNFSWFEADPQHVLLNAYQATTVSVSAIGVKGSMLAPHADVTFNNGSWDGTIVAESLTGYGEMHFLPFLGALPCDVGDPCQPGNARPDTDCDGIDDDCDGHTDEEYVPVPLVCGYGVCARPGTSACVDGLLDQSCTPGEPTGTDEECDNVDQNCDGVVDDGFPIEPTTCGVGACASTGGIACVAGAPTNTCVPGVPAIDDATCDRVDDDCDQAVDEDFVSHPTTCGAGVCASVGVMTCDSEGAHDSCVAGLPTGTDVDCDGLDSDCDGTVDEYCPAINPCMVETCDESGACTIVARANGTACEDGDECTGPDLCAAGLCIPGSLLAECEPAQCPSDLWLAGQYNVFVFEDYTGFPDVGGWVAAGSYIESTGFGIGFENVGGNAVVSGGTLSLSNGTVYGNIWSMSEGTYLGVDVQGTKGVGSVIDFASVNAYVLEFSARLAALDGVDVSPDAANGLRFAGDDPVLNVFFVSADALGAASSLTVDVPDSATTVINIEGTEVVMHDFAFFGVDATQVVFNAPMATAVTLSGIGGQGALVAPEATVVFQNGNWLGTLVAKSMAGGGEMHWAPFAGPVPCVEPDDGLTLPGDGAEGAGGGGLLLCSSAPAGAGPDMAGLLLVGLIVTLLARRRRASL